MKKRTDKGQDARNGGGQQSSFPLVGIGASAGGIRALQVFFEGMPADIGMAFVVVMHLAPDHESSLAQILQQRTAMPVIQVTERVTVEPNHVYVIPPNNHLSLEEDVLYLVEPQQPAGRRVAVDLFFRALSVAYGPRAVSVILSGADSDGVIGVKHIKEQGGLTIAQDPADAEFDSMPRSAIATGMVDWILPVSQMPPQFARMMRNELKMHVPPDDPPPGEDPESNQANTGGPVVVQQAASAADEEALAEVLRFLRGQTGHDFSHYKRATVLRRVARRLQVNLLEDIPSYLAFLRSHPVEVHLLLHDMLISVTNFFRDRDAFAALEAHIPQLFADKRPADQVRAWVAGCATGEEAYSVAMLLGEHAARLEAPPSIQVFATDLDEDVIRIARVGLYPSMIEADVSPERLRRFFVQEQGRYRIRQEIREIVLFSAHNLLKDSPFSRLDLVTCRNLLIYLKREAQEGVIDVFHYALRPAGLLFLGGSESIEEGHSLFAPMDKRYRVFVRKAVPRGAWRLPKLPVISRSSRAAGPVVLPRALPALPDPPDYRLSLPREPPAEGPPLRLGDLHMRLLEQFASPSIVVDSRYDIVHFSEHAARFLQFSGDATMGLLEVVSPALRVELRAALFRAVQNQTSVTSSPVPVELETGTAHVTIHVRPTSATDTSEAFILVVFEAAPRLKGDATAATPTEPVAQRLEAEIQHLKEQLSATSEQYEASVEELKASNEELQAINEEMRSATEEQLKQSEERFRAIVGQAAAGIVLADLTGKIARTNTRFESFLGCSGAELLGSDIEAWTHSDDMAESRASFARVTAGEAAVDVEKRFVRKDGSTIWTNCSVSAVRDAEGAPQSMLAVVVDITARKEAEEALRQGEAQYRAMFETTGVGMAQIDPAAGLLMRVNATLSRMLDFSEAELLRGTIVDLMHPDDRARNLERLGSLARGETEQDEMEVRLVRADGEIVWTNVRLNLVRDISGMRIHAVAALSDITERKRAERAQRQGEEQYRLTIESVTDYALFSLDPDGRITSWNEGARRIFGYELSEVLDCHLRDFSTPEDQEAGVPDQDLERARTTGRHEVEAWRVCKNGSRFLSSEMMNAIRNEQGIITGFVKVCRDLTESRRAEEERAALAQETTLLAERNRMAQELHDTLAQGFTGIKLQIEAAEEALREAPEPNLDALAHIVRARDITMQSQVDARGSIKALRAPLSESGGLEAMLERLAEEASSGGSVQFARTGTPYPLSATVENDLFRIGQEALNNALRHAEAQNVTLELTYRKDQVLLRIQDDGRGFEDGAERAGFGLHGMHERAERLRADLQIESEPGQGTEVLVTHSVPYGQERG